MHNPETGDVAVIRAGDALTFRERTWHYGYNFTQVETVIICTFAPVPEDISSAATLAAAVPPLTDIKPGRFDLTGEGGFPWNGERAGGGSLLPRPPAHRLAAGHPGHEAADPRRPHGLHREADLGPVPPAAGRHDGPGIAPRATRSRSASAARPPSTCRTRTTGSSSTRATTSPSGPASATAGTTRRASRPRSSSGSPRATGRFGRETAAGAGPEPPGRADPSVAVPRRDGMHRRPVAARATAALRATGIPGPSV